MAVTFFTQNSYRTSIPENIAGGSLLNITVSANDLDKGDYGVVRYNLSDSNKFAIDPITVSSLCYNC